MIYRRVDMTLDAMNIIDQLRKTSQNLAFHQKEDSVQKLIPICLPREVLVITNNDVWIGNVYGVDVYLSAQQFEHFQDQHLTIDVNKQAVGTQANSSFQNCFVIQLRAFQMEELDALEAVRKGTQSMFPMPAEAL